MRASSKYSPAQRTKDVMAGERFKLVGRSDEREPSLSGNGPGNVYVKASHRVEARANRGAALGELQQPRHTSFDARYSVLQLLSP